MEQTEDLLTVAEVAQICKLSVGAVYLAISSGKLKAAKLGEKKGLRILRSEMWIWIKEQTDE